MGLNTRIICNKCGINERYQVGQGIKDFDKNLIISYFSDSNRSKVEKILHLGDIFTFERVIGYCNKCSKYNSFPSLIYFQTNEKKRIVDSCECGNVPELVIDTEMLDNNSSVTCRKCKGALEVKVEGMFD